MVTWESVRIFIDTLQVSLKRGLLFVANFDYPFIPLKGTETDLLGHTSPISISQVRRQLPQIPKIPKILQL